MRTDVLITATSAPYTVVRTDKFPKNKQMHIFDLAFPRDVDAAIADYAGISLYNIEDIEARIRKNLHKRTKEIAIAENIIAQEVTSLFKRKKHVSNIESHQQK